MNYNGDLYETFDVVGDGNCLFRSLSMCLRGDQELHGEVRARVVSFVAANMHMFHSDVCDVLQVPADTPVTLLAPTYSQYMSRTGVCGGAVEILAFCHVYKTSVMCHEWRDKWIHLHMCPVTGCKETHECVHHIWYRGAHNSGHYQFMKKQSVLSQQPQLQQITTTDTDFYMSIEEETDLLKIYDIIMQQRV